MAPPLSRGLAANRVAGLRHCVQAPVDLLPLLLRGGLPRRTCGCRPVQASPRERLLTHRRSSVPDQATCCMRSLRATSWSAPSAPSARSREPVWAAALDPPAVKTSGHARIEQLHWIAPL